MEKLQEEFHLLLKSFDQAKILDKFIIIGSWAKEIYMENFPIRRSMIKTLDIDFSLIDPKGFYQISVNDLLKVHEYKPELTIHSKSITYFPATESNKLKIDFFGSGKLDSIAEERFKGKFLNFYKEGREKLKSREIDLDSDLNHGMEF